MGETTPFSGTVKDIPEGYAVWSFVKESGAGAVYPKYSSCQADGAKWDCGTVFPLKGDERNSDLCVALVGARQAEKIMQYVIDTQFKKESVAFSMPDGVTALTCKQVVQKVR